MVVDRAADEAENVLKMVDTLKTGEGAGSRFYYLLDDLVCLDFALSLFALGYLTSRGLQADGSAIYAEMRRDKAGHRSGHVQGRYM